MSYVCSYNKPVSENKEDAHTYTVIQSQTELFIFISVQYWSWEIFEIVDWCLYDQNAYQIVLFGPVLVKPIFIPLFSWNIKDDVPSAVGLVIKQFPAFGGLNFWLPQMALGTTSACCFSLGHMGFSDWLSITTRNTPLEEPVNQDAKWNNVVIHPKEKITKLDIKYSNSFNFGSMVLASICFLWYVLSDVHHLAFN